MVFCKHNEVAPYVSFVGPVMERTVSDIHFTANNQFEVLGLDSVYPIGEFFNGFIVTLFLRFFELLFIALHASTIDIVVHFLDSEHIAVVGYGYACHSVIKSLVYERRY